MTGKQHLHGIVRALGFLALVAVVTCSKTEDSAVNIAFDLSQVSGNAQAAMLAVISPDGEDSVSVLYSTDIAPIADLRISTELPNDPAAVVVMLTYADSLGTVSPTFLSPGQTVPVSLVHPVPNGLYLAPLETGSVLQPLGENDDQADLVTRFAAMVYIPEAGDATPTPTPTATPTATPTPLPDVIIDDEDPGTDLGEGASHSWLEASSGTARNGDYWYSTKAGDWYEWQADIRGEYEVFVRWPGMSITAIRPTSVTYWVFYGIAGVSFPLDQRSNANQWNSLGRFGFDEPVIVRVYCTLPAGVTECAVADAVLFVPIVD